MNSTTQIQAKIYKIEYATETRGFVEYAAETRNNNPRIKANRRADRICLGIIKDLAYAIRRIARMARTEIHPT
jgi:hypothetical protein